MNEQAELTLAILGAVAAGGWGVLYLLLKYLDERHTDLKILIETQFEQAEAHRREASERWRALFAESREDTHHLAAQLETLEGRVTALETDLRKLQGTPREA